MTTSSGSPSMVIFPRSVAAKAFVLPLMTPASVSRSVVMTLSAGPLDRVTWFDLGRPERVADVLARLRVRPEWAQPVDPSAIAV